MGKRNPNEKHRDEPPSSSSLPSSHHDGNDDYHTHRLQKKKKHKRRNHSGSSSRDHHDMTTDRHRDICLPPQGKTYLTIGQDLYSIQEYLVEQQNASLHWYMDRMMMAHTTNTNTANQYSMRLPVPNPDDAVPAAVMVYTDLQTLRGLDRPVDYGTGLEYADGALHMAMASHPHTTHTNNNYRRQHDSSSNSDASLLLDVGLQIGLWLNGTAGCHDIVEGKLDHKIHQLVYYLGSTCPANKIFLRIGYEFDNPQFNYASDPQSYKDAFQYIVTKCRKHRACRRRVVMVWHSWAAGLPWNMSTVNQSQPTFLTLDDFYPGDEWVDWVGISIFQQFYQHVDTSSQNAFSGGTVQDLDQVLQFAARHHKPTMIAESTPFGGIHNNSYVPASMKRDEDASSSSSINPIWDAWFEPTLQLIRDYDIAMWSYINCNWDVQPFWKGIGFGDTRLSIDRTLMDRWHDHVVSSRRFVRATDDKLCGNTRYDFDDLRDDDFDYDDDDDDDYAFNSKTNNDDGDFYHSHSQNRGHGNSRGSHHHDFGYVDDDDDYFGRTEISSPDHSRGHSSGPLMWGEERAARTEGMWSSILPAVMLTSSLAIIYFMYASTRRGHRRRIQRTPRAQRVRFAFLDAAEDKGDGSTSLYGSIHSIDSDESLRERRFVRRVGPNLLLSNTEEGSTLLA